MGNSPKVPPLVKHAQKLCRPAVPMRQIVCACYRAQCQSLQFRPSSLSVTIQRSSPSPTFAIFRAESVKSSFESEGSAPHQARHRAARGRCSSTPARKARGRKVGSVDGRIGGAVRGGVSNFGIFRGASRRANPRLAPRVRSHPARGPGTRRGRMGPEVGPAFQRRSRDTSRSFLASGWRKRGPGTWINKMHFFWHFGRGTTYKIRVLAVSQFSQFVTGGNKRPGNSALRAATRPAVRARYGQARYGWPLGAPFPPYHLSPDPLSPPTQPQRKNSTTSTLALDVVRELGIDLNGGGGAAAGDAGLGNEKVWESEKCSAAGAAGSQDM
eukprot:gene23306-biopygen1246